MTAFALIPIGLCLLVTLLLARSRLKTTTVAFGILVILWSVFATPGWIGLVAVWLLYGGIAVALHNKTLRRRWLSGPALRWFRKTLPRLSPTEHEALDAGTISWEAELFSGAPDWQQLERLPGPQLNSDERAFIDGPLQTLLSHMADTIQAEAATAPIPANDEIWAMLKKNGFFGMAIPRQFGGLGFSAHARSCILARVGSAPGGATLGPIIATPNGLGPAQLLLACGTEQQKAAHLPRLARGDDVPCFALTSVRAGTDAAAITDYGTICERTRNGQTQLGIKLNWTKRHITLAPVATLVGLAIHLRDPDRLLGGTRDLGITCVLVASDTDGVDNSNTHQPVGAAFPYGSSLGHDVFVPLDAVIGGAEMIGRGWQLLMEYLPIGRAITTPSASAGVCTSNARLAGAYARVRSQFKRPIGAFEGVEEVLARIGGHTYACEAVRLQVANAVDLGERPAIAAGIAKYHCTTRAQQVTADNMLVHAGKAVCAGPANPVAANYAAAPLAATADGTNLFTRSMLIFGQGGIRCHPFLQAEIKAARHPDPARALAAFDAVFPTHAGHALSTAMRCLFLGFSGGRGSPVGQINGMRRYQQRVNRYSAALALVTDVAMVVLGDNIRHRESLSGRLGDILSQLYIATAAIQHYYHDGSHRTDLNLLEWVCEDCFGTIEQQLAHVLRHLPRRSVAGLTRLLIFPLGRHAYGPSDDCNHRVASTLQTPSNTRDRLTAQCFVQADATHGVALFDAAQSATADTVALRKRLRRAIRRGELTGPTPADCMEQAHAGGLLDDTEYSQLDRSYTLRDAIIRVDTFKAQSVKS